MDFLQIAPEICFIHRFEKLSNLNYVTADMESPLAKVKMDIHKMPFEDHSFDAVMCNHVLEHVEDDILSMREIVRVLKPGGWAILQVPFIDKDLQRTFEDPSITTASERERIYGQDDHVRLYGKDYAMRLTDAGFRVKEDDFVKTLPEGVVSRYALPPDEIIYFCRKQD
jgi:SAM-dependent methyltransferase